MVYDPEYQRGRSGRPISRIRKRLKIEGSNICWLCSNPIDISLPHTDRMSWTVDHVLPLSLYPHLALELSNMREAHRSCNSARGQGNANKNSKITRDW